MPGAALLALGAPAREFAELYLPLLSASAERPFVLAHLGQSVDNCIATSSGDSHVVTGRADFVHMHRLRALSDAIVVGGGTVAADDPTLTTRLVPGPSPVRVVLDPGARLPAERGVFRDGLAPTLHLTDALSPIAVLEHLHRRGLHAVFVEGGGVTITRWVEAGGGRSSAADARAGADRAGASGARAAGGGEHGGQPATRRQDLSAGPGHPLGLRSEEGGPVRSPGRGRAAGETRLRIGRPIGSAR